MKRCRVFDPLVSKRQQLLLATQLVRAVLKIDDVVSTEQISREKSWSRLLLLTLTYHQC